MNTKKIRAELKTATHQELIAARNVLMLNLSASFLIGNREEIRQRLDLVNVELENRILAGVISEDTLLIEENNQADAEWDAQNIFDK